MMNLLGAESVCSFLFGHVPQASAFDQAVEILGKIGSVVSGTLQGLGHQKDFESGSIALRDGFGQVLLEQGMADSVDIFVHLQDPSSTFEVQIRKSLMNQVKHFPQNGRHLYQLAYIRGGNLYRPSLDAQGHTHDQVSNALQISR